MPILFFNVGPFKEDIFSGHLLSPVFQPSYIITMGWWDHGAGGWNDVKYLANK